MIVVWILKILQVDAETFLNEKTVDNGKLVLKGKVCVNVLYVPESESDRVECIKGCFDFYETVKRAEFDQNMDITAICDAKKIGYKLINSRKVGIEAHIGIDVNVTEREYISFISGIEEELCQVKTGVICINEACDAKEFTFKIDETVDIPCKDAAEVLKSNVSIIEKDYQVITGKTVIKGKASASVLYVTEKGRYEHFDFDLPFTEVFDSDNIQEGCECEISYEILETEFKLIDNVNEEGKTLSVYIEVRVLVRTENCIETEYVQDCYFTDSDCHMESTEIETEKVLEKPMFSTIEKYIIEKKEDLPEISSIYTSVAKPYITSIDVQNGRIAVSGRITICVLYMSDNAQCPLSGMSEEMPFSHMIDCANASKESDVLLNIECEHISCVINGANNVEVRCGIGISGRVVKKSKVRVISDITLSEIDKKDKALIIYFVKEGDTLWSIGKNYHVKCDSIRECNHMEGDELFAGQKIIIPVVK